MTSDADLVELTTASTTFEAEWLVGALKGLDVDAVTFGDQLADEYAMSQKLMGLSGGVRIMVPRGQLERARRALADVEQDRPAPEELEAALAAAGGTTEDEDARDTDTSTGAPGGSGKIVALALLTVAVAALTWLCVSQQEQLWAYERASPVSESEWRGDYWETRWRHNDEYASISVDRNRNGVSEETWLYDRKGRLYAKMFDRNENEVPEVTIHTDADGNEQCRVVDANENGIFELYEYPAADGVQERWLDADEDHRYERYEFVDTESGEVLDAFEDRGREGFVRVK